MGKAATATDADGPGFVSLNDARAASGESPSVDEQALIAPTVDPPAESEPPAPLEWSNWRYIGHRDDLVYTAVPVTPQPGDVVGWWGPPGHDGLWESTDDEVTRMPDNHRPEITEAEAAKLRGDETL